MIRFYIIRHSCKWNLRQDVSANETHYDDQRYSDDVRDMEEATDGDIKVIKMDAQECQAVLPPHITILRMGYRHVESTSETRKSM